MASSQVQAASILQERSLSTSGGNFRDSYKDVGLNLDKVEGEDPVSSLRKRTSIGTAGNLGIEKDERWLAALESACSERIARLSGVYQALVPGISEVIL